MSSEGKVPEATSAIKKAYLAIEKLQAKVESLEAARTEPIAIVGMGCRFPGAAGLDDYWRLLRDGVDAIREVPPDRWDAEALHDPVPGTVGKMSTREGGFLDGIDRFDPAFFGIAPREAMKMDPQQRLLLEVAWESLEHAGIPGRGLEGSDTGVFMGVCTNDYALLQAQRGYAEDLDSHYASGVAHSILTGRVSYLLGLRGPSVSVDTACSSSLVALHLACQALRSGDCRLALAGGVNIILVPDNQIAFSMASMMAPDGRCKTFDAAADGYVRGEGCGVVVLKSLTDAEADGDRVLAVVRGSAVNQDGASSGLTAPNGPAQQEVIREALKRAGVTPAQISYVEAHGTGTALGDPIEVQALGDVLCEGRSDENPLRIGSVKTNVGHLEAAAGVAGLIKVVLALRNEEVPPSLHFNEPNPLIPWQKYPQMEVAKEPGPWASPERLAGISSFGFSGTNAHVVVGEAPESVDASESGSTRGIHVLPFSAGSEGALEVLQKALAEQLVDREDDQSLADLAHAAGVKRSHYRHRAAVVARTAGEALECLTAEAGASEGLLTAPPVRGDSPPVAFLFTGQGAQAPGMGRSLFESAPAFRARMLECDAILQDPLGQSLLDALYGPGATAEALTQTRLAQPALFALGSSLAALWESWGILPSVVMGHSVGELVAAHVAGVFTLEEGLRLVATRGALMQEVPGIGTMAAALGPEGAVRDALDASGASVSVAAINGPLNTVLSGPTEAIEAASEVLKGSGIKVQALEVSHAFHSPQMDPILETFREVVEGTDLQEPRVGLISNLTGERVRPGEITDPDYWIRHIREPVQFHRSIQTLREEKVGAFLELGPHSTLTAMGRACLDDPGGVWVPSLRRGEDAWECMARAAAKVYVAGFDIDWAGFDTGFHFNHEDLPTYPFQRESYWLPDRPGGERPSAATSAPPAVHPLMGARIESPVFDGVLFQGLIGPETRSFLKDHRVGGQAVLPATAYLDMLLAAGVNVGGWAYPVIEAFDLHRALVLPHGEQTGIQVHVTWDGPVLVGEISSRVQDPSGGGGRWVSHAAARILPGPEPEARDLDLEAIRGRVGTPLKGEDLYSALAAKGIEMGPLFRVTRELWVGDAEILAEVDVPPAGRDSGYQAHPVALDSSLQAAAALLLFSGAVEGDDPHLPYWIDSIRSTGPLEGKLRIRGLFREGAEAPDQRIVDLEMATEEGLVIAELKGVRVRKADPAQLSAGRESSVQDWLYEVDWIPQDLAREALSPEGPGIGASPGSWLVFSDGQVGKKLAEALRAEGKTVVEVGQAVPSQAAGEAPEFPDSAPSSGPEEVVLHPLDREEYGRLLDRVAEAAGSGEVGVVHLWSLYSDSAAEDLEGDPDQKWLGLRSALLLSQVLSEKGGAKCRLWLASRSGQLVVAGDDVSPEQSALWGFGRTFGAEEPEHSCVLLDLPRSAGEVATDDLVAELRSSSEEPQVAWRGGKRFVARLTRSPSSGESDKASTSEGEVRLAYATPGLLESVRMEKFGLGECGPGLVQIQVEATGLNFRDVLIGLGLYPDPDGKMGGECAGWVVAVGEGVKCVEVGDRVMARAESAFSSTVLAEAHMVAKIPDSLSWADAATIPMAFTTAFHSLVTIAGLSSGQKVLIHAASGGVGQAAVQIARAAGAEIFATAGNEEKRAFLRSQGIEHVLDSRSLAFKDQILEATGGAGVDVVLNSISDDHIPAGLSLVEDGGWFLEMGRRGIWEPGRVASAFPGVRYHIVELTSQEPEGPAAIALASVAERIRSGELSPLPHVVYGVTRAQEALRFMAQARHIGKIVFDWSELAKAAPGSRPRFTVDPDGSYWVSGGTGALGVEFARALAEAGARHLVLLSRNEPADWAREHIKAIEASGVSVDHVRVDVSDKEALAEGLEAVRWVDRPVRGVVHAAGVLSDSAVPNLEWDDFEAVFAPKVRGAENLLEEARGEPLDFFVLFSSLASSFGSPGQGNYAAANGFLDGLAARERRRGVPIVSMAWGLWGERGMAAVSGAVERLGAKGVGIIDGPGGVEAFCRSLEQGRNRVLIMPVAWDRFLSTADPREADTFFADFRRPGESSVSSEDDAPGFVATLSGLPARLRSDRLIEWVRDQVRTVLGGGPSQTLPVDQPFQELGMDSLMAVELRNILRTGLSLGKPLSATVVFDYPTVLEMGGYLLDLLWPDQGREPHGAGGGDLLDEIERMTEDEVDAMLSRVEKGDRQ